MATVYLIHGFVGAGKTTFCAELEKQTGAVRFTPDEWMVELYGTNPPAEKFADYLGRIFNLIEETAQRVLTAGSDVILDFGFWTRESRDAWRAKFAPAGHDVKLIALQCPVDIMRERVRQRTEEMPAGALFIDDNAFDLLLQQLEPVNPDEEDCTVVKTG